MNVSSRIRPVQPVNSVVGARRPTPPLVIGFWVLLGVLAAAVSLLPDPLTVTADSPVTVVGVAVLSYLAAAVGGRRWMGWAAAGCLAVLVVLSSALEIPTQVVFAVVAVVLTTAGLWRSSRRTWPQAVAAAGYLGIGVVAMMLDPRLGLVVAGLSLTSHVVWDVVHYRRDAVVNRSLALWCMGLDVVLGVSCIAVAAMF